MSCCDSGLCDAARHQFTARRAESDLRRYHQKGPIPTTRMLRDVICEAGGGETVLDIGAGVGALSFELIGRGGFRRATAVDASSAYVATSRREAERRGQRGRFTAFEGDFVEIAGTVPPADVVVLDRVVCCYPALDPLLDAAFTHSHQLVGLSYPHDRWYVRLAFAVENLLFRLRRNPFRTFLHSPAAMDRLAELHGFRRLAKTGSLVWSVTLYGRGAA